MVRVIEYIIGLTKHAAVQGSAVVMVGSMGANVLAYLFHLIVGRILGPEQYGELTALLSLFYIINAASSVLQISLAKFFSSLYANGKPGEAKTLFLKSTRAICILCLVGLVVASLLAGPMAEFLQISSPIYFVWLYLIFAAYTLAIVPISVLQAYQKFAASSVLVNIGGTLRLLLGIAGAYVNVGWVLIGNIVSNAVMYGLYFIPLRFLLRETSKPLMLTKRSMVSYSLPALATTLGITALFSQDVLLVKHFFLPLEAGIYASLSVLGKVIFFASSALGFVLFPIVAQRRERKEDHHTIVLVSMTVVGGISCVLSVLYFLFPRFIVHALFGTAFDGAIPYVGWFGVFLSLFTLSSMIINVSLAAGLTRVWVLTVAAAIFQFALLWLIHGTLGVVISVNISVAAVLFVSLLLYYGNAK